MPNIYANTNYRDFLKTFYEEKKAENASFSYRLFSRICGFSSPNFIKLIMDNKRNLSNDGIKKIISGLKLKKTEARFFETLVHFNQSESYEEKKKHFEKLSYFKAFTKVKKLDTDLYEFLSKWYYPTIREITLLKNFKESPQHIVKNFVPDLTEEEVSGAIKLLKRLGLLTNDEKNRLVQAESNLSTDTEVFDLSVKNFHHEMIKKAGEALDNTPQEQREISSITVAVNKDTFEKTKKKLIEFRRELNVQLSKAKNVDTVYQINFQFFNLTEIPWKTTKQTSK